MILEISKKHHYKLDEILINFQFAHIFQFLSITQLHVLFQSLLQNKYRFRASDNCIVHKKKMEYATSWFAKKDLLCFQLHTKWIIEL